MFCIFEDVDMSFTCIACLSHATFTCLEQVTYKKTSTDSLTNGSIIHRR